MVDSASLGHASVLPAKMAGLRSCMICKLVKNESQFEERGCDNCDRFVRMQGDRERVHSITTTRFRCVKKKGCLFCLSTKTSFFSLSLSQWICWVDGRLSLLGCSLSASAAKLGSCHLLFVDQGKSVGRDSRNA